MKSRSKLDWVQPGRVSVQDVLREQLADLKNEGKHLQGKGLVWDCLEDAGRPHTKGVGCCKVGTAIRQRAKYKARNVKK